MCRGHETAAAPSSPRGIVHLISIEKRILSLLNIRGRTSRGACDEGNSRLLAQSIKGNDNDDNMTTIYPYGNVPGQPAYFVYLMKNKNMLNIKKTYLTDEKKRPVAVQVDIETFERMEQLLEDYALGQFIEENNPAENLSLNESKEYYRKLKP